MSKLAKALTAAAGNAGESLYVEDVFSTYLYDGTGATQAITNGIGLDGEGGLVWIKTRDYAYSNNLFDTARGSNKYLISNSSNAEGTDSNRVSSFNSNGFTLGTNDGVNGSSYDYVGWSFRKAEKFFDVVTYTGDGVVGRTVAHSLGSVPGSIIIKRTNAARSWIVYHQSTGNGYITKLDSTAAKESSALFNNTTPTDALFTLNNDVDVNASGGTYVAYIFASDAGGFGDDEDENIIKCGTYTGNGSYSSGPVIDLGFEPQWVLIKNTTTAGYNWQLGDTMRGASTEGAQYLTANTSNQEAAFSGGYTAFIPTATGFTMTVDDSNYNRNGDTYVYIAIRRPMKTPEAGTEVFAMDTGTTSIPNWISNFVTDFVWYKDIDSVYSNYWQSRLTGSTWLKTDSTDAQGSGSEAVWDFMDGFGAWSTVNNVEAWMFKRATGFMDVVAYTGTGSGTTQAHNLGVVPELAIVKRRDSSGDWRVTTDFTNRGYLNDSAGFSTDPSFWNSGTSTSTTFPLGTNASINASGGTYVTYLFATVAGVSKVGSYTGTAATLNVDCGFSAGARFILIKRTDSTGDWYVWDSVRGIVAGNDPYLLLNSSAAQVTNTDYIDPLNAGFTVTSNASSTVNVNGGTYIFLAIA